MAEEYEWNCRVYNVVDGDTVDAMIEVAPIASEFWNVRILQDERIRLLGIDTPESRTRNRKEKKLGLQAKAALKAMIAEAVTLKNRRKDITVVTSREGRGKFGRVLGRLIINKSLGDAAFDVCDRLTEMSLARPYFGGSKNALGDWTTQGEDGQWLRWTKSGYVPLD